MLNGTRELIDAIRANRNGSSDWVLANARAAFVARHGGVEDADALLDVFLEAAGDYRRACVLDPVMRLGTRDTAHKMASACLAGGRLREQTHADVLHALGYLGYTEARDVLWRHAAEGTDYYHEMAAALGLLNLPCDGLEREIEAAIRALIGRSLFPEFLPVLAHKLGDPELLSTIFDLGRTTASTDCNGGIVYGVALFGEAGRPFFDRLLFDPLWEAYGPGTGTGHWSYHGFRHLGGSIAALAGRLREWHATMPYKEWEYRVQVWLELTQRWLGDPLPARRGPPYPPEAAADVYGAAFNWSSDRDDSLTGLVRENEWIPQHEVYALRDRLEDRIAAEVFHAAR